jgi:hypothetical protein
MALLSKSPSAFVALAYVTGGALIEAWSLLWYLWLNRHPPEQESTFFFCYGLIATGAILFFLGLSLGAIGRSARRAELPPPDAPSVANQVPQHLPMQTTVTPVLPAVPVASPPVANAAPRT